jgi:hypothetical protein
MENRKAVKLKVTNSHNDNESIEWFFALTQNAIDSWIKEKDEEQRIWNHETAGAVSYRYYNYTEYDMASILEYTLDELEGMRLKDFLNIIKLNIN